MIGIGTRDMRSARDDGRGMPYRIASDDWFGGWATASSSFTIQAQGTEGDDVFVGTGAEETYHGLGGNDTIDGGGGRDDLFGDDGDDTIDGGDGKDVIAGGLGHDVIYGGKGKDTVRPDVGGGDTIYGGNGDDSLIDSFSVIFGGGGNDFLRGQGSELHGGAGNDYLEITGPFLKEDYYSREVWGGSGADTFDFDNGVYSLSGGGILIHDLSNEDTIDLSVLDANERKVGDQEFHLVPVFEGHAKEMTIRYDAEHDRTLIELYTNKDMKPDGTIIVPGDHTDFVNFVF